MENLLNIVVSVLIVFVLIESFRKYFANKISNELLKLINENKKEEFNNLIEKFFTRFCIHPFNRHFLKLSLAISENNDEEVKKIMNVFKGVRLNNNQKEALYSRCFQYYLTLKNKENATKYYKLLKEINPKKNHDDLNMIYDTYILDGYSYIEEYEAKLVDCKDSKLIAYESHIAQMYKNKNDIKNADKYQKLVEKHLKEIN